MVPMRGSKGWVSTPWGAAAAETPGYGGHDQGWGCAPSLLINHGILPLAFRH